MPGAVRVSAGFSTSSADVDRLIAAIAVIASGEPPPVPYDQDPHTGDFWPHVTSGRWATEARRLGASCSRG